MKKLFPTLANSINHKEPTTSVETVQHVEQREGNDRQLGKQNEIKNYYFSKEQPKPTDDFTVCALLDQRGRDDAKAENIYFKSEVVVRDKDYGWAVWNGLSTTKGDTPTIHLEYRLLLFKKNGSTWTIDKGFGWISPRKPDGNYVESSRDVLDKLQVVLPKGVNQWKEIRQELGNYSQRKVWSAIAKVDPTSKPVEDDDRMVTIRNDLLSSLKIYMDVSSSPGDRAEFFGGGNFSGGHKAGYVAADKYYDPSSGWKTINKPINLKDSLKEWYLDQMDKELKWMTCDQWARGEGRDASDWEETMKEMCYTKPQ